MDSATMTADLLRQLHRFGRRGVFCLTAAEWCAQLGISGYTLPDLLDSCVDEGLIEARTFDGQRMRLRQEWSDRNAFFNNAADNGFVRVRITEAGLEYFEKLRAAGKEWGNRKCVGRKISQVENGG